MNGRWLIVALATSMLPAANGSSAVAAPTVHPDCVQYGNQLGVPELEIDTKSHRAKAPSGSTGIGLACGAAPDPEPPFNCARGAQTLYDKAEILYPVGARIASTRTVLGGSYVGSSLTDAIGIVVCTGSLIIEDPATVRAYPPGINRDCPDEPQVVACYFSNSPGVGNGWQKVEEVEIAGETRHRLTVLPVSSLIGDYTVAKLNWDFCTNFGDPGTTDCGGAADPLTAYNGSASAPDCSNGAGIFSITVAQRGGEVSDPAELCEVWLDMADYTLHRRP